MKKIISKFVTICMMATLLSGLFAFSVSADEPAISYEVDIEDTTATVTLFVSEISSFDIGVAYDPEKVVVKEMVYTDEFYNVQLEGNTVLSVQNEAAQDEQGNTYAVFVGAGYTPDNQAIDFTGQPLGKIVFEGDLEGTEIAVISNTATVSDVYTANVIGTIDLGQGSGKIASADISQTDNETDKEDKKVEPAIYIIIGVGVLAVIVIIAVVLKKKK